MMVTVVRVISLFLELPILVGTADSVYSVRPIQTCSNCGKSDYIHPTLQRIHLVCCRLDILNTHLQKKISTTAGSKTI